MSHFIKTLASIFTLAFFCGTASPASAQSQSVADYYRQSYRLEGQRQYQQSIDAMLTIRKLTAASYFVELRLGWLQYLAGNNELSAKQYRRAAGLAPRAIEPLLGLTLPLLASENWRELEQVSLAALKLDAGNRVARARLAHAHYMRGNYPDAAVLYRQLVADYPSELDHQTGLGWAIARLGRGAEAKKLFRQVLAVSPDNLSALQGLALKL